MSDECAACGQSMPSRREQIAEMEKRMVAMTSVIAAAEERGRRAIEERDDYARALYDLFMSIPPPQDPRWQAAFTQALPLIGRIKRESLAPRDSGPECGHLLSRDLGAEWRCGKPKGHEGPHSGTKP